MLSKRISCHLQEGNILNHFKNKHNSRPVRATSIDAFEIIDCSTDLRRLKFLEAIHIANKKPSINVTQEAFLLPSMSTRNPGNLGNRGNVNNPGSLVNPGNLGNLGNQGNPSDPSNLGNSGNLGNPGNPVTN